MNPTPFMTGKGASGIVFPTRRDSTACQRPVKQVAIVILRNGATKNHRLESWILRPPQACAERHAEAMPNFHRPAQDRLYEEEEEICS